jgi:triacylglycerol lipase
VKAIRLPILFTGHSLGAALAALAASLFGAANAGSALYTIGSPRVGNPEFAATLDALEVQRYVDCCDLVTRVPPPEMGYTHVAKPNYVDRNGLITVDPSDSFTASDRAAAEIDYLLRYAWRIGNVGVRDLADHTPVNYVWAVTAANHGRATGA